MKIVITDVRKFIFHRRAPLIYQRYFASFFFFSPQCVGKKPGDKTRKRNPEEPTFVEERVEKAKLPKVTIKKNGDDYTSTFKLDLKKLNPKANITKEMELRLKTMHKAVSR